MESRSHWSASAVAADVRAGRAHPVDAVEVSLVAIGKHDGGLGAFVIVRGDKARAEAAALADRDDLDQLPLAGVPVAIKDNLDVIGEPTRHGSRAYAGAPATTDHPAVARLRDAGAIIVGKTAVPELCVWGSTEGSSGRTRNPWHRGHVAGGSSGGSAAAVAAGMVPLALGNDGMGSIRIPAAVCGLFGIKPGPGVVPSQLGASSWFGMAENGPLTTSVEDARLMLAVLSAGATEVGRNAQSRSLRIALSTRPPVVGTRVDRSWRAAAEEAAQTLAGAGHQVTAADPPYAAADAIALAARWTLGTAEDADGLDVRMLQRRTRGHIRFGSMLRAAGAGGDRGRDDWAQRLERFFDDHDVLVTPTLAQPPPGSRGWHERSWLANIWRDANYAPFAARFNLAAVPAASVPWGTDSSGLPLGVQLVAWRGGERMLMDLAAQLEALHPWRRFAPAYGDLLQR